MLREKYAEKVKKDYETEIAKKEEEIMESQDERDYYK
jgi:hypothetical protein